MKIKYLVILLAVVVIFVALYIFVVLPNNENGAPEETNVNVSQSGGQDINKNANINSDSNGIVMSEKRATAPTEAQYEVGGSGLRCWVYDLNDYIPTKDEVAKTYTWIIEFPDDDCVIGKPVTNLPETVVGGRDESIFGTNYHRTIINYE